VVWTMIAPKRVQRERKEAAGPERCMPVSIVFSSDIRHGNPGL
jgi:hypothetical protein